MLEDRAEAGDAGGDPDLAEGALMPEAMPAALVGYHADGGRGEPGVTRPMPAPPRIRARSEKVHDEVEVSAVIISRLTPHSTSPLPSSRRTGMRTLRRPATGEPR